MKRRTTTNVRHRSSSRSLGLRLCAAVSVPLFAAAAFAPAANAANASDIGSLQSITALSSQGAAPVVVRGQSDDFYNIHDVNPTTPGEILRKKETAYNRLMGDADFNLPDKATKIMYTTTTQHGDLVPVTGYVVEPNVEWKGPGPRPTLVVGRGTVGQGDQCAPSRQWPLDNQPDPITAGRLVNLEGLYDWVFLNQGVRVVVTDYVGMGTEPVHTYMNRLDQAHAMADAARAARNLVGAENFGKIGFYGHSQGGGASAAAVEEVSTYAKDLDVAGAYASAPPADLNEVQKNIDGSDLVGAIGFSINGLLARYPELRPILDQHLSAKGKEVLEDLKTTCTDEIEDKYGNQTTSQWTNSGKSLDEIVADSPEAQKAMDDQLIGKGVNAAPIMIISGRYDQNVEYKQAKTLARKWCEKGGKVVYRDDILPEIGKYNHFIQAISGGAFGFGFMLDRFRGVPVSGECQISDDAAPGGAGSSPTGSAEASSALSAAGSLERPAAGSAQASSDGRAAQAIGSLFRKGSGGSSLGSS
ncbi:lipase [Corynebacterium sp. zg254]|uniref:Lipase n=1 Tax=Corynebacterium zhongnanshanii TaxID=2768834 RepID=A0ABQ6VGJ8_9CORY|nr:MULTISPECIES: lipase family protein [Corynebacterium]KAB3523534.1 lipase [Corynebacterium zhongnanshanii]MCR5913312.1 lipase [Corynebacterium sp. zg254]